jgi:type IX secretion system PorP/SprF family membrane protein
MGDYKTIYRCFSCLLMMLLLILAKPALKAADAIFSQYYATSLYLNPAFAGTGSTSRLALNYRHHPMDRLEGMQSLYASVDGYYSGLQGGIGLMAASDRDAGLVERHHVAAIYAYHMRVRRNFFLNFGVQAGYFRRNMHWDPEWFTDPAQPPPDQLTTSAVNFAAGAVFHNEKFYGGLAAHHLTQPRENMYEDEFRLSLKYTAHFGYMFKPPEKRRAGTVPFEYLFSPNVIYQVQGDLHRLNLGVYGGIEPIMAGLWYRESARGESPGTLVIMAGVVFERYRIGYSYDHSLSGFSDAFHAVHEISITYKFLTSTQRREQRFMTMPVF